MAAATIAADGPPSTAQATTGAIPTSTTVPPGIRTDAEELKPTNATQKISPGSPPIASQSGCVQRPYAPTTNATTETTAMYVLKRGFIGLPAKLRHKKKYGGAFGTSILATRY